MQAMLGGSFKVCTPPICPVPLQTMHELDKPADASDIVDLQQAKLEIVKLRRLLEKEVEHVSRERLKHMASKVAKGEHHPEDPDGQKWANLNTDPRVALQRLKVGNARFVSGTAHHPHEAFIWRHKLSIDGQQPFATVLGCSDSRAPIPVLFDAGVGDIFCVCVAGNVKTGTGLASIEYGVAHLGTPVLLVLGHTSCGAVTAAINHANVEGHIPRLLNLIEPARAMAEAEKPGCPHHELIPHAIVCNVWLNLRRLLQDSEIVLRRVAEGKLKLEAAIYDIDDGRVTFLGAHPQEAEILQKAMKPPLVPEVGED